ncbi:MAG: MaoC family dehydratase [Bryobacteraceae bacterium]
MRVIEGIEELKSLKGQPLGASGWFTVEQPLVDAFADATKDRQWIHVDPERAAKESPYGATIAHGFLTLSLLSHLISQAFRVQGNFRNTINYGLNRVRFTGPVIVGSRIRGHFTLQDCEDHPWGVQSTYAAAVEREGELKPVLVAEWITRIYV